MSRFFSQLVAAAAVTTTVVASPAAYAQDSHIALIKQVTGPVSVTRAGQELMATSGMRLYLADRLVSGPAASAAMVFRDGTGLTLGSSADISLRAYTFEPKKGEYAFDAYLAKGTALYSSGKIAKMAPDAVKVGTPTATVGVRGTRFIVEAQ